MMTKILLIGGSNDGTRILTSDPNSPVDIAARGQVAASCDHRGTRIGCVFERYIPRPLIIGQRVMIIHVIEDMSDVEVWECLLGGYRG
jgi:hypothetical protein